MGLPRMSFPRHRTRKLRFCGEVPMNPFFISCVDLLTIFHYCKVYPLPILSCQCWQFPPIFSPPLSCPSVNTLQVDHGAPQSRRSDAAQCHSSFGKLHPVSSVSTRSGPVTRMTAPCLGMGSYPPIFQSRLQGMMMASDMNMAPPMGFLTM